MLKHIIILAVLVIACYSQRCPYPSTDFHNGYSTRYCYYYAGKSDRYDKAVTVCNNMNAKLVMPKTDAGLDDLYSLYKGYSNFYFWVHLSFIFYFVFCLIY